jgi:hypothetical protein
MARTVHHLKRTKQQISHTDQLAQRVPEAFPNEAHFRRGAKTAVFVDLHLCLSEFASAETTERGSYP